MGKGTKMRAVATKVFAKQLQKQTNSMQQNFETRLELFLKNPDHSLLNAHRLIGKYQGFHSFNVTGDYRAIFEYIDKDTIRLHAIGSHSQLYK